MTGSLSQQAVAHTLRIAAQADIAVVGVGGTDDGCTMVRSGCCPPREMARLRAAGAVGDILGNYFDISGRLIASGLEGRIVGLTLAQLCHIDTVIVVASESADKADAFSARCAPAIPDVLIIDETSARRRARSRRSSAHRFARRQARRVARARARARRCDPNPETIKTRGV